VGDRGGFFLGRCRASLGVPGATGWKFIVGGTAVQRPIGTTMTVIHLWPSAPDTSGYDFAEAA
jgi:hypothetical protein